VAGLAGEGEGWAAGGEEGGEGEGREAGEEGAREEGEGGNSIWISDVDRPSLVFNSVFSCWREALSSWSWALTA